MEAKLASFGGKQSGLKKSLPETIKAGLRLRLRLGGELKFRDISLR